MQAIWKTLHSDETWANTQIAIASKCDEPTWAHELLGIFQIDDGVTMKDACNHTQIHYGTKQTHLKEISDASGIDLADMIFFDDQWGNCSDVAALGVTSVLTPEGVTAEKFAEGLAAFQQAKAKSGM